MDKTVAALKRNRTARLAKLITKSVYLHRRKQDDKMYNMICEEFVSLGGVYIKFLQGVLLSSKIMSRWNSPDKMKIFENVVQEPMHLDQILAHELGPDKLARLINIQPEPFAAGSFGQVYYAQLLDGQPVVIKVLRPMLKRLLKHDLRLLGIFSKHFFTKLYPNMDVNVNEAISDFMSATLKETDYIEEARFANELYEAYTDHPLLVIPKTHLELCTPNIIVQGYVEGLSVAHLIKLRQQGADPRQYVLQDNGSDLDAQLVLLGYELLHGIFNLPRIQGDPHPGNIRLLSGNRVGLIDFGISARSTNNKAAFFGVLEGWNKMYTSSDQNIVDWYEQCVRFFVSDLYRALKKLSSLNSSADKDANFTREIGTIANEALSKYTGGRDIKSVVADGNVWTIVNEVINKDNRFGFKMRIESSEILRASQTYLTLVEALGCRDTVLPSVLKQVVHQVSIDNPEVHNDNDDNMSVSDALEVVGGWLERVAQRDPSLFKELMTRIKFKTSPNVKIPVKEEEAPSA